MVLIRRDMNRYMYKHRYQYLYLLCLNLLLKQNRSNQLLYMLHEPRWLLSFH